MAMAYEEDQYLMLSGLQHFLFCRRQWALIHIEQQWKENELTTDGAIFHSRVHDESAIELRNGILTVRGMKIASRQLGVSGACDAVEFIQSEDGVTLRNRKGKWLPVPIEYKRGKSDILNADAAQLCAEAMCLEEMLCCSLDYGYLFWGEKHRREKVAFDAELRNTVMDSLREMHQDYERGYTPKVKQHRGCKNCSLREICLPEITKVQSVESYLQSNLGESECETY